MATTVAGLTVAANVSTIGSFALAARGTRAPITPRDALLEAARKNIEKTIDILKEIQEDVEAVGTDDDKRVYRYLVKASRERNMEYVGIGGKIQAKSSFKIFSCWKLVQKLHERAKRNMNLAQTTSNRIRLESLNAKSKQIQLDAEVASLDSNADLYLYATGKVGEEDAIITEALKTCCDQTETLVPTSYSLEEKGKGAIYHVKQTGQEDEFEDIPLTTFSNDPSAAGPSSL